VKRNVLYSEPLNRVICPVINRMICFLAFVFLVVPFFGEKSPLIEPKSHLRFLLKAGFQRLSSPVVSPLNS